MSDQKQDSKGTTGVAVATDAGQRCYPVPMPDAETLKKWKDRSEMRANAVKRSKSFVNCCREQLAKDGVIDAKPGLEDEEFVHCKRGAIEKFPFPDPAN